MSRASLIAHDTYERARIEALDAGADPADWPDWDDLPRERQQAMIRVVRLSGGPR